MDSTSILVLGGFVPIIHQRTGGCVKNVHMLNVEDGLLQMNTIALSVRNSRDLAAGEQASDANGIMVLVEVSIPEVAAREIPRSHRRNQTIGAHGYQKQTVLKRTDEKSLDLGTFAPLNLGVTRRTQATQSVSP